MTPSEMVTALDGEIDLLQRQLLLLRSYRNSFTPLCRLPAELLLRIFRLLQERPEKKKESFELKGPDPLWLNLVDTCSYVRSVAINLPELWTFVDCTCEASQVKLFAERAGSAPLFVQLSGQAYQFSAAATLLASDMLPRAVGFDMMYCPPVSASNVQETSKALRIAFGLAAVHLQSFVFTGHLDWHIHERLFGGWCPKLRSMSISGCSLKGFPELPALRELKLDGIELLGGFQTLLEVLLMLPALHLLDLRRLEGPDLNASITIPGFEFCPLPHLKQLSLTDNIFVIQAILSVISQPSHVLHVKVTGEPIMHTPSQSCYNSVVACMVQFWSRVSGGDLLPNGRMTHDGWTTRNIHLWALTFESSKRTPSLSDDDYMLHFSTTCEITEDHELLPLVRSLTALHPERVHVLRTSQPRLPALKEIIIRGATKEFFSQETLGWFRDLHQGGNRLSRLVFQNCYQSSKAIVSKGGYSQYVGKLEWVRH